MPQATLNEETRNPAAPDAQPGAEGTAAFDAAGGTVPSPAVPSGISPEGESFGYHSVPVTAPLGFFLGLASGLSLLAAVALPVCLAGAIVSWIALRKIRGAGGELGGAALAKIGLAASLLFFVAGLGTHSYAYATEVPQGYRRVNFNRDISRKQFVFKDGLRELHPDVVPLKDQKIYIKGYMWNVRKQNDLSDFILLKDNGKCCFGGNPKPYDMMQVVMKNGKTIGALDGLIAVAGTLRCHPEQPTVYVLEATLVERARTPY